MRNKEIRKCIQNTEKADITLKLHERGHDMSDIAGILRMKVSSVRFLHRLAQDAANGRNALEQLGKLHQGTQARLRQTRADPVRDITAAGSFKNDCGVTFGPVEDVMHDETNDVDLPSLPQASEMKAARTMRERTGVSLSLTPRSFPSYSCEDITVIEEGEQCPSYVSLGFMSTVTFELVEDAPATPRSTCGAPGRRRRGFDHGARERGQRRDWGNRRSAVRILEAVLMWLFC
ncbi:hypothetical protein J8273_5334 [Carpediemonas membranifera]|uniref:Uncharacterized protein n=1 Tax=Carpediemonas membranifera TaxID=201153 RepID=A0A8J6B1L6_9EUKA|nr:hypothetical protein J8273_5334 [Carpediemonas membranifera]|eukprot:KAG9392344.1 hypothetical protein J8273_5334 [Carpediemonas membranifera]